MSLDEDIYVNLEELEKQAHGQAHSDSRTEGAEAVLASETAHFKVATVCLGVLSLALLVAAVGVGAKYSTACGRLMRHWVNLSVETQALQIQILNLTVERDQINTSYFSVKKELDTAKVNTVTESCPAGWKRFGCRCYILSQVRDNWDRSGRGCRVMGADLAVIKSQEEMMFLNKLLGEKVWIGLSRSSGSWSWTDGSSLMTSYWQDYQPTGTYYTTGRYQLNKNCAAFNRFNSQFTFNTIKSWSSESCNSLYKGVCEKKLLPSVI